MTDKEKLVGLIRNAHDDKNLGWYDLYDLTHETSGCAEYFAEYLLSNGVTFATDTNDGCKYCKTDKDGYRATIGGFWIANSFHGEEWTINAGRYKSRNIYFCPMCGRKLSEPPKDGE